MALPPEVLRAVRKYGPRVDDLARTYRNPVTGGKLSGTALLAKLVTGESRGRKNAVSNMGARSYAQFMPQTRQAVLQKTGGKVDPWRNADDAVEAAVMHLKGELGHRKGLAGYNPGMPSYTNYILSQKVGKLPSRTGNNSSPSAPSTTNRPVRETEVLTTPGIDREQERQSAKLSYLRSEDRYKPGGLVSLKQQLDSLQDVPASQETITVQGDSSSSRSTPATGPSTGSNGKLRKIAEEAERIDRAKVRYQWGGGHSGKQQRGSKVTPLDCSGAVSRVLGIDPRVSGQFTKFGSPGRAPNGKGVTIYANDEHVLMEIDGRFWGTSKTNPGGGPGWIKRESVSKQYLSRFTARHLKDTTR